MDNMRRGNNSKRSRNGRPNNRGGKPPMMNRSLESNTPDGNKVRGNANQLYERYTGLAREAQSAGDRVAAEGFLQYAEHYYRVLSAAGWKRNGNGQQQPPQGNGQGRPNGNGEQPQQDGTQNAGGQPQMNQRPNDPQGAYNDQEDENAELGPVN